jgi:hypothetical protein
VLGSELHLFDVEPKVKWIVRRPFAAAYTNFNGPSEPNGLVINYYQKAQAAGDVSIKVLKGTHVIAEMKGPNAAGINQVLWNMQWTPLTLAAEKPPATSRPAGREEARPSITTFGGTVPADPGEYTVVVQAGGRTISKKTRIIEDVWFDKVF